LAFTVVLAITNEVVEFEDVALTVALFTWVWTLPSGPLTMISFFGSFGLAISWVFGANSALPEETSCFLFS
jgi:hypothetical protein